MGMELLKCRAAPRGLWRRSLMRFFSLVQS